MSVVVREPVWALSLIVSVPGRAPNALGVKVMNTLQFAPAPRVVGTTGQLEVAAKSPVVVIEEMVNATL